jgi:hypothetical protein
MQHRTTYPCLSRMALDYLTIPGVHFFSFTTTLNVVFIATSVDVERIFSRGCLLLSRIRSRLSTQTTRALLCLGCWSQLGLVKDKDVLPVARLPDVEGDEKELKDGWDSIVSL